MRVLLAIVACLCLVTGCGSLLHSCTMDVSIPSSSGGRVMNIGLLAQQASAERWGFGLVLAGFAALILRSRIPRNERRSPYFGRPEKPSRDGPWRHGM